ncbi:hypothetical protein I542_3709 [Mycobacteroides abscessus 1948]|uniref:Uncharacterized protein n=1 Tax=Mycobacteroides abscessus 1948 TaxID=1299323 RepID=A0A829QK90_9MYCO|nr:hypothetical protein I542_3709 [Mycobacteroides abscessus 1948]
MRAECGRPLSAPVGGQIVRQFVKDGLIEAERDLDLVHYPNVLSRAQS